MVGAHRPRAASARSAPSSARSRPTSWRSRRWRVVSRDGMLVDQPGELARQLGLDVRYGAVRTFTLRGRRRALRERHPRARAADRCAHDRAAAGPGLRVRRAAGCRSSPRRGSATPRRPRPSASRAACCSPASRGCRSEPPTSATSGPVSAGSRPRRSPSPRPTSCSATSTRRSTRPSSTPLGGLDRCVRRARRRRRARSRPTTAGASTTCWCGAHRSSRPARVLREAGDLSDHFPVVAEVRTAVRHSS